MISICCPTRGRPDNVRRLIASASATADHDNELIFYVDHDDPELQAVTEAITAETAADTTLIEGDRILLSETWNACARQASYDVLMHCGDDIVFETPGWDRIVLDAFAEYPDHIAFVHGDDGHWGTSFGTHGFLHRLWVDTVGYFVPPYFACDWNDTWLNDVANMLGRRRFVPIVTRHLHFVHGTREVDQTDRERMAAGQAQNSDGLYAAKLSEREADATKLSEVIERAARIGG